MDRLTSLTVFGRVVECGGFSAAARRLNMSVTMVSNHVQALEDRLGVRLLNRTTRKISLTDIGTAYYERSRQILLDLEEADQIATAQHATPQGTLRIYCGHAIVRFLAPVIADYLKLYPAAAVELTGGERMIDMIEEGFDLAILTLPPPDSSLVVRRLTAWRHMLCCAPSYLEGRRAPQTPADLAEHNCLRYAFYPFGREWRFEAPDGSIASVEVGGNFVTNSPEALRLMVLDGQGLFLAPTFVTVDDLAAGKIVSLMPDYRPVEFSICATYPNRHHLATKTRSFIDLLADSFASHRKWMNPGA